jgi:hypothetical protein
MFAGGMFLAYLTNFGAWVVERLGIVKSAGGALLKKKNFL